MAVPKKKTSKSRRGMRRAHLSVVLPKVFEDKETGGYKLAHHASEDGMYNGKNVLEKADLKEEAK